MLSLSPVEGAGGGGGASFPNIWAEQSHSRDERSRDELSRDELSLGSSSLEFV